MAAFTKRSFDLLSALAVNNTRDWYAANKPDVEAHLLAPFAKTLEAISFRMEVDGLPYRGGKKTMFRMHRDVRFSKDKSPYKTNVSGMLTPGGTRSEGSGFVYLHLEPDGSFAACGRYNLSPKALGPIRDKIVAEPERFGEIVDGLKANGLDLMRDLSLKSMPRGYAEHADHPHAEAIKLKSMVVKQDLSDADWLSGDVVPIVSQMTVHCRSFIEFVAT